MYKIQLSGVIMIGSITLKCRFGEKLWSNWRCISPPFFEEERSFFLFLPVYFNRQMKAMLVSSIINIFDGKFYFGKPTCLGCFANFFCRAGRVHCDVQYVLNNPIMCILFFNWSHEYSPKGNFRVYYHRHPIRLP